MKDLSALTGTAVRMADPEMKSAKVSDSVPETTVIRERLIPWLATLDRAFKFRG